MSKKDGWTKEEFEQMRKEMERRYQFSDKTYLEHRGWRGYVSKRHNNIADFDEWVGIETSTGRRISGDTFEEAEQNFKLLVDAMIAAEENSEKL
ncbi:MAG: hypothetical protein IKG61_03630 [Selenomonadaceae bacterium]|nr:hypothetical protein [Selenomonadaceae bacterium]